MFDFEYPTLNRDKMYKTHIKQWGLDKKNKEPEMRAIVCKHKQRADQGKLSTIHIRGQIRTIEEAFRYWERKGVSIDDIVARQTASPTPEAVKFFTPVPSPILTPQVLAIPERMFRATSDYIKGSFESGMWYSTNPVDLCLSIKDKDNASIDWANFFDECELGFSLSRRKLSYEAEQTLRKAMIKIERVFSAEIPSTLTELFELIVYLRGQEMAEMALIILRQFSVMGKALLGSEHPVTRIYEWLDNLYESDFGDIAFRCVQIFAGHLESSVGPLHLSTLYSRLDLIQIKTKRGEGRMQKYQRLLGECEKTLRSEDPRVMELRGWIAEECFFEGRYDDAMSLVQTNIAHSQDQSLMSAGSRGYSCDLDTLARCQHALGDVDLGIATLHQAIDIEVLEWGTQDARARYWLLRLEEWYLEQDSLDSAAMAQDLRLITLESMDVD